MFGKGIAFEVGGAGDERDADLVKGPTVACRDQIQNLYTRLGFAEGVARAGRTTERLQPMEQYSYIETMTLP